MWVQRIGIPIASACPPCLKSEESIQHLLFLCPVPTRCWSWFCGLVSISPTSLGWNDIWQAISSNSCKRSALVLGARMGVMAHSIWKSRNQLLHHNKPASAQSLCSSFSDEATLSLARITKPFQSACLEGIFSSLNLTSPCVTLLKSLIEQKSSFSAVVLLLFLAAPCGVIIVMLLWWWSYYCHAVVVVVLLLWCCC